ncbi:MAG: hypothetical protein Q8O67_11150 [Deltaproteobacteria bacterium]|nr:hypothetical protein [Deltaproteobacteria bacterium]
MIPSRCETPSVMTASAGLAQLRALFDLPVSGEELDDIDRAIKVMSGAPPFGGAVDPGQRDNDFKTLISEFIFLQEIRRCTDRPDVSDDEVWAACQHYWDEVERGRTDLILSRQSAMNNFIADRIRLVRVCSR